MDLSQRKQQFSIAYVRAVAAVCGYAMYTPEVDDDSIDQGIAARGTVERRRSPRLELQLKCTAIADITATDLRYAVSMKNYDDLRDEAVMVPRILVVVAVPDAVDQWLRHTEDELALRRCGYWVSLRGRPDVNNTTNITISLPRMQRFTSDGLQAIMQRIGAGGLP